jgi:hypothetical protein
VTEYIKVPNGTKRGAVEAINHERRFKRSLKLSGRQWKKAKKRARRLERQRATP